MKQVVLFFSIVLSSASFACDCIFQGYFGQVAPKSELVALVRVSDFHTPEQPAGSGITEMNMQIIDLYRGDFPAGPLTVTYDKFNTCQESFVPFVVGEYYLLALQSTTINGKQTYELSSCGEYWMKVNLPLQSAISEKYERLRVIPLNAMRLELSSQSAANTITSSEYPETDNNITQKALISQLSGTWMNKQYLVKALKDRSFYSQHEFDGRFFGFSLSKTELTAGKGVLHGFSVHEGGDDIALSYDKAANRFRPKDPAIEFYRMDSLTLKMIAQNERNLVSDFVKTGYDVETTLRSLFLSGKYVIGDTNLVLQGNGNVSGWGGYKYFDVIYDFGLGIHFDAVIFYKSEKESSDYAKGQIYRYVFKENNLLLIPVKLDPKLEKDPVEGQAIVLTKIQ